MCDSLYTPMKFKELAMLLQVPKENRDELRKILEALEKEGKIYLSKRGKMCIRDSLLGAAVGDAMGSATETKSTRQIEKVFGGRVTTFCEPPMDTLARGRKAGQITDAFSIPYILTKHLLQEEGKASRKVGEEAPVSYTHLDVYKRQHPYTSNV